MVLPGDLCVVLYPGIAPRSAKGAWGFMCDQLRKQAAWTYLYSGLFVSKMSYGARFPKVCSTEQEMFMRKRGSEVT